MADTTVSHTFKIILLGDSGVGKSQLLQRFTKNKFNEAYTVTIGVEFASKQLILKNKTKVSVQIWDTVGQDRYKTVTRAFYRGAVGALLVYDITDKKSFESSEKWLEDIKSNTESQIPILLVGNKKDLQENQQVQTQNALDFAQKNNLAFYSSSAKTGENVDVIFSYLVEEIYSQIEKSNAGQLNSLHDGKSENQISSKLRSAEPEANQPQKQSFLLNQSQNEKEEPKKKEGCCS